MTFQFVTKLGYNFETIIKANWMNRNMKGVLRNGNEAGTITLDLKPPIPNHLVPGVDGHRLI